MSNTPKTCNCHAYPFPHRPNGGDCRHDDIVELMDVIGYDFDEADAAIEGATVEDVTTDYFGYENPAATYY